MVTAYAIIANGGRQIEPTLIDRIQDRFGRTIYQARRPHLRRLRRAKPGTARTSRCIVDNREQVLDPMTAYQITSMMEGVVQRGTGTVVKVARQAGRRQDRHDQRLQGRLVRRLHARPRRRRLCRLRQAALAGQGRDRRRCSRRRSSREFMQMALADKPPIPFRVPPGMTSIPIDRKTGLQRARRRPGTILEAFKPGTGAARHLLDHRLYRRLGPAADGRPGVRPRGGLGDRRAVLTRLIR